MLIPAEIEKRLLQLSEALDEAQKDLAAAEDEYQRTKANYELGMARCRMGLTSPDGKKMTAQEREDQALLICEEQYRELLAADAWVKASRANTVRLRTQVDITRSLGTGLRASMDIV